MSFGHPRPYLYRSVTSDKAAEICKAIAAGVPARAVAAEYGVSVRTIYRARERGYEPVVTVVAGDWATRFAITAEGPVRVEPWRPRMEVLD